MGGLWDNITWGYVEEPIDGMRPYYFLSDAMFEELIDNLKISAENLYDIEAVSTPLQEDNGQLLMF